MPCHFVAEKSFPFFKEASDKYLLPCFSELIFEEPFADIYLGWNASGIACRADIKTAIKDVLYPDFEKGDAFELFIDTRDLKTAAYNTKFCHQFFFLPKEVDQVQKGEITHFRTEDLETTFTKKSYTLYIFLPKEILIGYDPFECARMGFSYRVHRKEKSKQHFTASSELFALESKPSLWSSLQFIR
jgi:hypothetical protein